MRCNECGYMNDKDTVVCTKCGTKLTAGQQEDRKSGDFQPLAGGAPTIKGKISSQPAWDAQPAAKNNQEFYRCPDCSHYPLQQPVSDHQPCPNCNSTGVSAKADVPASKNDSINNQQKTSPAKTARLENVNFGAKPNNIKLTDIQTGIEHEFRGNRIELNRDNLDPGNDAISSNHAHLSFKNGTWHILDQSSNEATFVQVQGKTPLTAGCKVIIGNRIYKVDF